MTNDSAATPALRSGGNNRRGLRPVQGDARGGGTTAIWQDDGTEWRLLAPTGFPGEQTLRDLVEEASQILPLAGDPRLVVLGKEVLLGNGYADLVAVEPSGSLVVVEIKPSRNAKTRDGRGTGSEVI